MSVECEMDDVYNRQDKLVPAITLATLTDAPDVKVGTLTPFPELGKR